MKTSDYKRQVDINYCLLLSKIDDLKYKITIREHVACFWRSRTNITRRLSRGISKNGGKGYEINLDLNQLRISEANLI